MVLDYIGRCRQSSLMKTNRMSMAIEERKQNQERCRLFRDLYADIESRILSLAHNPVDREDKTEATGIDGETDVQERKVQVSSFCLWD